MIDHQKKIVFIHIPKTGGTSVSKQLGLFDRTDRGVQDHRPISDIEPFSLAHLGPAYLARENQYLWVRRQIGNYVRGRRRLSACAFGKYFKFAFVRNSWSRTASWYRGVMRDDHIRGALSIPIDCTFRDFLLSHGNQWHLKSQLYWIRDARGEIALDFVGRFERLEDDYARVCGMVGLEYYELPQELMYAGQHYTDLYDELTRQIVADRYAEEIALFDFKFGQ